MLIGLVLLMGLIWWQMGGGDSPKSDVKQPKQEDKRQVITKPAPIPAPGPAPAPAITPVKPPPTVPVQAPPAPGAAIPKQQVASSRELFEQGRKFFKENKFPEAIEKLQASIQLDPNQAMAHYILGWTFNQVDRSLEAVEQFKQAITLKPDYALAYDGLAWTYNKLNLFSDAIAAGQQAIRLNYQFPEAQYNLGMAYLGLGNRELAMKQYNILEKMNREKAEMLLANLQQSKNLQTGPNPSSEDLRREIERLVEKLRTAHRNKDINMWLACYHSSYPNLKRLESQVLELWKNYDVREVSYRVTNVQSQSDHQASANLVWNIQVWDHRTHDYTLLRPSYKIILQKDAHVWTIRDSREEGA